MNLFSRTRLHLFENYRCARTSNLSSSKLSCLMFFCPKRVITEINDGTNLQLKLNKRTKKRRK